MRASAVLLPCVALALIVALFVRRGRSFRDACILSTPWCGAIVVLSSESLSLFHAIFPSTIVATWVLADGVLLITWWRLGPTQPPRPAREDQPSQPRVTLADRALLAGVALIVCVVGLIAILSPPNTYDAMVYHLPRVIEWLQHHDLQFFMTGAPMQLHHFPGAELVLLHLHGLSGGDRFDNLLQWSCMAGSLVGVSLIARELGADRRGQVLAAVVCATIPQGVLYASGSKNDYVAAFWLVCALCHALWLRRKVDLVTTLGLGLSLGLAALTKATTGIFALPILVAIALQLDRPTLTALLKRAPLVAAVALLLVAGHAIRNQRCYGSPIGPTHEFESYKYGNDAHGPAAIWSGVLRNAGLHMGTPFPAVNQWEEKLIVDSLRGLGIDPDDPRTTWPTTNFHVSWRPRDEVAAGNPLHALSFVLALALLIFSARARGSRPLVRFGIALVAAFVLFSTVFRWQPWHTRLHLPLFVVASAWIATVWSRVSSARVTTVLGALLLLAALPAASDNQLRPLFGPTSIFVRSREDQYFAERPDLRKDWGDAAHHAGQLGCPLVAIDAARDFYTYPMMAILEEGPQPPELEFIGQHDETARFDRGRVGSHPCAVLCINCGAAPEAFEQYQRTVGPAKIFGSSVVFASTAPHL